MENENLMLSATNIRYMLALYQFGGKDRPVKCVDVANALNVTRPSVHAMIKSLADFKLVDKSRYGKVSFTPAGLALAERYLDYYQAFSRYLGVVIPQNTDISDAVCAFIAQLPSAQMEQIYNNMQASVGLNISAQ